MPGKYVPQTWLYNPTIYAPARYKKACRYDAYIPDRLNDLSLSLEGEIAGLVSEAEAAIASLNAGGGTALRPLAKLLLRTESIASSKIEGMQIGVRELARAESRNQSGLGTGAAAEIIANIEAMTLAMEEAAQAPTFDVCDNFGSGSCSKTGLVP